MKRLSRRIRRARLAEVAFRTRETWYRAAEALQVMAGRAEWTPEELSVRFIPRSEPLEHAREALRHHQPAEAAAAIRSHFLRRPARFVIDPQRRDDLRQAILTRFPSSGEQAVARASRVLRGAYDLLGYESLSFGRGAQEVDWHFDPVLQRGAPLRFWTRIPYLDPSVGDHKVIWELNRHQHWLALGRAAWLSGDAHYAAAVAAQLHSWMRANPPLRGINWASMLELAFRSISWIWTLHFLAPYEIDDDPPWILGLLVGLDRQLDHIARHLSIYFSPNTHLLGEGLALYVGGRVLPEMRAAARWERIGRAVLLREATAQVNRDGGHAELSTHYHRYALDFYLLALAIARITGDSVADRFADVASRLATFCRAVAADDGRLPTIGDDDGGQLFAMCGRPPADGSDSLAVAAALLGRPDLAVASPSEQAYWICGDRPAPGDPIATQAPASRLFPDSGYAVLRSAVAHAVLDAGRHGFVNGGHAHADALSVVLSVRGRPLLIDPGTATYTTDPRLRDWFRSTSMHNTVVVDGRPQSIPDGPFHWSSRADAHVDFWRSSVDFDYVEASHDGYLPLVHRRAVIRVGDDVWLIADHLLGFGTHEATAYWHLDPSWTLSTKTSGAPQVVHPAGLWAAIASTAGNSREYRGDPMGLGWCAPVYGQRVPSLTLSFDRSGELPLSFVTAVAAAASPFVLSVESAPVVPDHEDAWHRVAAVLDFADTGLLAVFATPHPAGATVLSNPARSVHRVALRCGELATDARVAVLRFSRSGEPLSLSLVEASLVAWSGATPFKIAPIGAAEDLHLDLAALRRLGTTIDTRRAG